MSTWPADVILRGRAGWPQVCRGISSRATFFQVADGAGEARWSGGRAQPYPDPDLHLSIPITARPRRHGPAGCPAMAA